jgi:hypothetical protein
VKHRFIIFDGHRLVANIREFLAIDDTAAVQAPDDWYGGLGGAEARESKLEALGVRNFEATSEALRKHRFRNGPVTNPIWPRPPCAVSVGSPGGASATPSRSGGRIRSVGGV